VRLKKEAFGSLKKVGTGEQRDQFQYEVLRKKENETSYSGRIAAERGNYLRKFQGHKTIAGAQNGSTRG